MPKRARRCWLHAVASVISTPKLLFRGTEICGFFTTFFQNLKIRTSGAYRLTTSDRRLIGRDVGGLKMIPCYSLVHSSTFLVTGRRWLRTPDWGLTANFS